MKHNKIRILGIICTIGGFVLSLVSGFVEDKKMDEKISKEVQKHIGKLTK